MVFSFPRHAAHRGVAALLLMALTASLPLAAHAGTPAQRQELAAALRQLDALERFVAQSAANTPITAGERYHFDYPRLLMTSRACAPASSSTSRRLAPSHATPPY